MIYHYEDQLNGERLTTRFIKPEDTALWRRFLEDAEATRFFPKHPLAPGPRAYEWTMRQIHRYETRKYGLQWLLDRTTGNLVGQCGLLLQEVDGNEMLEVGYHIFPEYWGRGYAPEAARMFMQFARDYQLSDTLTALIRVGNTKSERVAGKLEMLPLRQTRWNGVDIRVWVVALV